MDPENNIVSAALETHRVGKVPSFVNRLTIEEGILDEKDTLMLIGTLVPLAGMLAGPCNTNGTRVGILTVKVNGRVVPNVSCCGVLTLAEAREIQKSGLAIIAARGEAFDAKTK